MQRYRVPLSGARFSEKYKDDLGRETYKYLHKGPARQLSGSVLCCAYILLVYELKSWLQKVFTVFTEI